MAGQDLKTLAPNCSETEKRRGAFLGLPEPSVRKSDLVSTVSRREPDIRLVLHLEGRRWRSA